jgi:uncharacterized GH25 family protein
VRGLALKAGEETEADLVLDWGRHVLRGVVVDESGAPLAGAEVSLRWENDEEGTKSTSSRSTITDDAGRFSFSELGRGVHTVVVVEEQYRQAQIPHDVGSDPADLQIQLVPAPRR